MYDEEADGFSGNWTENDLDINPSLELFPRRFVVTSPEIPANYRDEHAPEIAATYRVAVPDDVLEM